MKKDNREQLNFFDAIPDNSDESTLRNDKYFRHGELVDFLHKTYVSKNKDYGDSFAKVHKEIGWESSLGDIAHKFYRLQNLMQNKDTRFVKDETILDTILDMSNYLLMLYMEIEDEGGDQEI